MQWAKYQCRIRTIWFSLNKEWGSQRLWELREVSIAIKESGAGLKEFSRYWDIYFEEHLLLLTINPIKGLGSKAVWKFFTKLYNIVGEGYPMCAKKDPKYFKLSSRWLERFSIPSNHGSKLLYMAGGRLWEAWPTFSFNIAKCPIYGRLLRYFHNYLAKSGGFNPSGQSDRFFPGFLILH